MTVGSKLICMGEINVSSGKVVVPLSAETLLDGAVEALRGNTFGILSDDGSQEEKIVRLLNLLPMAFQVMDEARDTIVRLREQVDSLRVFKQTVYGCDGTVTLGECDGTVTLSKCRDTAT